MRNECDSDSGAEPRWLVEELRAYLPPTDEQLDQRYRAYAFKWWRGAALLVGFVFAVAVVIKATLLVSLTGVLALAIVAACFAFLAYVLFTGGLPDAGDQGAASPSDENVAGLEGFITEYPMVVEYAGQWIAQVGRLRAEEVNFLYSLIRRAQLRTHDSYTVVTNRLLTAATAARARAA